MSIRPPEFVQLSLLGELGDADVQVTTQEVSAPQRTEPPATLPMQLAAPTTAQATWVHAQANRHAVLRGQQVGYHFRRGQRRTIGFSVTPLGLTVSAPRWTSVAAVDAALQTKADWVLRKLTQVGQQTQLIDRSRLVWADGVNIHWLGGTVVVRLGAPDMAMSVPTPSSSGRNARKHLALARLLPPDATSGLQVLALALPQNAGASQIRDAVQAWMMQAAQQHFEQRLHHFAALLGVRWTSLRLSSAATRWGSAKHDGSIRLHWRLVEFAPEVVDYVVAHELAHLRHMDHSARFWQTVASVVPDYAALRAMLKGERLPPW